MRKLLLMFLLLAGVAGAAVVPDGSQLPPSDPDAPTVSLPSSDGGPPVKVSATGPASRQTGGSTVPSTMGSTSLSSSGGTGGQGSKAGTKTPSNQTVTPSPAAPEVPRFTLPNGQPVPWSLIALAVLLFMFSVGGGVYFYQSRDE